MSRSGAELCGRCGSKTEGVGYGQRQWRSHVAWTRGARAGPGRGRVGVGLGAQTSLRRLDRVEVRRSRASRALDAHELFYSSLCSKMY